MGRQTRGRALDAQINPDPVRSRNQPYNDIDDRRRRSGILTVKKVKQQQPKVTSRIILPVADYQ